MKNPWEDSLIFAIRDAQWLWALKRNEGRLDGVPGAFLKLSGQPEKNLGDVVAETGEMFYLFEAKSARGKLHTEWTKLIDGAPQPKRAFTTLATLANEWRVNPSDQSYDQAVWTSLRCHHFIYWSERVYQEDDDLGSVHVVPYLVGCTVRRAPGLTALGLDVFGVAEKLETGLAKGKSVPLSALRRGCGFVVEMDTQGHAVLAQAPFGVPFKRFQAYLTFLSEHGGSGNGDLNAIVCSSNGYLRRLKRFEDLRSILTKTKRPEKKILTRKSVWLKANVSNVDASDAAPSPFPTMRPLPPPTRRASFSPKRKKP